MKTMLRSKQKSLIIAVIAIMLLLAVGVSFCAWDTASVKNLVINNRVAEYGKHYILGEDVNGNARADVGDTVFFGKYYQEANQTTKSPYEWVVVDIRNESGKDVMYLLSKHIPASGTFYGAAYYNSNGDRVDDNLNFNMSQCYNESTLRAWFNSTSRFDGGTGFNTTNNPRVVMNGFYNEAFSANEKSAIIPRNLGAMKGYAYSKDANETFFTYDELKSEKVWAPSYTEIFGTNKIVNAYGTFYVNDSSLDRQFSLFTTDTSALIATKTKYAGQMYSCYTSEKANNDRNNSLTMTNWLLRTPSTMKGNLGTSNVVRANELALVIVKTGIPEGGSYSNHSSGLTPRPAICIAR